VWVTSLFSFLGTAVGGLFGLKQKQGEVVEKAIGTFEALAKGDTDQANAAANAIKAVYEHGNLLERSWRPLLMYVCMSLMVARWFGYSLPSMGAAEVEHLYTFMYIGLSGYITLRSIDKWMMGFQIGSLLKSFITKKLL
jgi:hypothetical protein